MTRLDDLHKQYGELCIQLEIIQNKTIEVKKLIAEEMNKQIKPVAKDGIGN